MGHSTINSTDSSREAESGSKVDTSENSTAKPTSGNTTGVFRMGWNLLTAAQRRQCFFILIVSCLTSGLEIFALSAAAPLVALIVDSSQIETSSFLQWVGDLLGTRDPKVLTPRLGIGVIIILLVGVAGNFATQVAIEWFGVQLGRNFSKRLLADVLRAPYVWFVRQSASELAHRIYKDPTNTAQGIYPGFLELVYTGLLIVFAVAAVIVALPLATTLTILFMLLLVGALTLLIVRPLIEKYSHIQRISWTECYQLAVDAVNGAKEVIVNSRQTYFENIYDDSFTVASINRLKANVLQRLVPLILLLIGQLSLIFIALYLFISDTPAGEIATQIAFLGLVTSRLIPALSRGLGTIAKIAKSVPFMRGVEELHQEVLAAQNQWGQVGGEKLLDNSWSRIELRNISYRYPDASDSAVQEIDLVIERGKTYGIVGASGAGKSTLVDILLGLLRPSDGSVLVDGLNRFVYSDKSWFGHIGYVPQLPFFANESLTWNVGFGLPAHQISKPKVDNALSLAKLNDVVSELPDGVGTILGDRGQRLSGGQRQRVAMARALYDQPSILVLDEATSALDSVTEARISEAIESLRGQVTVIMIAHRHSTIQTCDEIIVLDGGRIVGRGQFDELVERGVLPSIGANG